MGAILGGTNVVVDILVHEKALGKYNKRLQKVLEKARALNFKLNKSKCVLAKSKVDYVEHRLTGKGLKPGPK